MTNKIESWLLAKAEIVVFAYVSGQAAPWEKLVVNTDIVLWNRDSMKYPIAMKDKLVWALKKVGIFEPLKEMKYQAACLRFLFKSRCTIRLM
jgi:hypothetical protein